MTDAYKRYLYGENAHGLLGKIDYLLFVITSGSTAASEVITFYAGNTTTTTTVRAVELFYDTTTSLSSLTRGIRNP